MALSAGIGLRGVRFMENRETIAVGFRCSVVPVLLVLLAGFLVTGCALVKPHRQFDETTPIDLGLRGASREDLSILSFRCDDAKWGDYAARRLSEFLLEEQAFTRVVLGETDTTATRYVLRGHLELLFYGGSDLPTEVALSVSIKDTADGTTRFFRKARASSHKSAVHMTWFMRVPVPAPYPEEVLNSVLRKIALDIAQRSRLPEKE
ncbi:MAG TPA: hypothetical protein ENN34_03790 [Deltaproteobacteria bacterium]|nr:hypothetical protein [Deltaproteobacteria bacterium]